MYKYLRKNVQFKDKINNKSNKNQLQDQFKNYFNEKPSNTEPEQPKSKHDKLFWCTKVRCFDSTIQLREIHEVKQHVNIDKILEDRRQLKKFRVL